MKIRRIDSKRISLEYEGFYTWESKIRVCTENLYVYEGFLLREYIDGCTLEKFLETYIDKPEIILKGFETILREAFELDLTGIDLVEISRPLKQVIYRCCNPDQPVFIDFESARISPKPLNITKVVNFLIKGSIENHMVRDIVGLSDDRVSRILELTKHYKKAVNKELRRNLVEEIIELLSK